ncbi:helix-turn-helix domain-containing protein [Mesorhizobium sp. M0904]
MDLIADHAGGAIAQEVCRHAIVDGQRPSSNRQTALSGISYSNVSEKLFSAVQAMEANLDEPLSMDAVAKHAGVSRRQLERRFITTVGLTPAKHYMKLRVDHAKRLIEGTRMPLVDISLLPAVLCLPRTFLSASKRSKARLHNRLA